MYKHKPTKKILLGILGIFLCITIAGGIRTVSYADEPPEEVNVLMIGNSFTKKSPNNVGRILREMAASDGKKLNCKVISHAGAYLSYYAFPSSDHRRLYRKCMNALKEGNYDYIILQERTKASIEHYEKKVFPAVNRLCTYISTFQPQAEVFLYETAAFDNDTSTLVEGHRKHLSTQEFQERVLYGYTRLEQNTDATMIPIGMRVYNSSTLFPSMNMVSSDRKHPSYAGYYLAAASLYQKIYGTVPDMHSWELNYCDLENSDLSKLNSLLDHEITLNSSTLSLAAGQKRTLDVVVTTPSSEKFAISWKSLDPKIADVNPYSGKVTGVSEGTTAVIAETSTGLMAVCCVKVTDPIKPELSFDKEYYLMRTGNTMCLLPRVRNGKTRGNYKWSSSNSKVASVDADGTVTAHKMGTASITVMDQKDRTISAHYTLHVSEKKLSRPVAGISEYTADGGEVSLSWQRKPGAVTYMIYRSDSRTGSYELLGQSSTDTYTDTTAMASQSYYYKISAMAKHTLTESRLSPWVRISIPENTDSPESDTTEEGVIQNNVQE